MSLDLPLDLLLDLFLDSSRGLYSGVSLLLYLEGGPSGENTCLPVSDPFTSAILGVVRNFGGRFCCCFVSPECLLD